MLKTVPQKRFIFSPSSINNSPYKINFSLDLPLKNCALGGGLFPARVYGNLAEYANRPNFYRSEKLIERVLGRHAALS